MIYGMKKLFLDFHKVGFVPVNMTKSRNDQLTYRTTNFIGI
jgi:hypothetical protein